MTNEITLVRYATWAWCFGISVDGVFVSRTGFLTKRGARRAARQFQKNYAIGEAVL